MHEASIALSLIEVAQDVLRENGGSRVSALTVRLGQWSAVVPEALHAAFPAAAQGTPLEGARLSIVRVAGVGECPQHGPVTLELTRGLRCPICDLHRRPNCSKGTNWNWRSWRSRRRPQDDRVASGGSIQGRGLEPESMRLKSPQTVQIDETWTPQRCTELLNALQSGQELTFYAADHCVGFRSRRVSPGAASRPSDPFMRKAANHGWSSLWTRAREADLADELHRNRAHQRHGVEITAFLQIATEGKQ